MMGAEYRFGIVRTEWVKLLQIVEETGSDVLEINLGVNVDYSTGLLWQNVLGDVS